MFKKIALDWRLPIILGIGNIIFGQTTGIQIVGLVLIVIGLIDYLDMRNNL